MEIVGALDLHRTQITFKWLEMDTGEIRRGRIMPVTRESVREWLGQFSGQFKGRDMHLAVEATTGWRFVVEEMQAAGITPHLAEPADTSALRGPKRHAKTDSKDCDHMVDLLLHDRLPESWIAPTHILEVRTLVRVRKALVAERREWQQRMQAQLFHQGAPRGIELTTDRGRNQIQGLELSPAGRMVMSTGFATLDHLAEQLEPLDAQLISFAKRQRGCKALLKLYGVGHLSAVTILAELGDCRRFSNSDDAVRYAGLDISVYESNGKRSPGHLSRQGPATLRWMLYEAAQSAARKTSPDHDYYLETRARINHKRACLSVARKLCRRSYHILKNLGEAAMEPVGSTEPAKPEAPVAA